MNGRYTPIFFLHWDGCAVSASYTSQRSAAPAVAAKIMAGAMAATGVTAAAAAGLGN